MFRIDRRVVRVENREIFLVVEVRNDGDLDEGGYSRYMEN